MKSAGPINGIGTTNVGSAALALFSGCFYMVKCSWGFYEKIYEFLPLRKVPFFSFFFAMHSTILKINSLHDAFVRNVLMCLTISLVWNVSRRVFERRFWRTPETMRYWHSMWSESFSAAQSDLFSALKFRQNFMKYPLLGSWSEELKCVYGLLEPAEDGCSKFNEGTVFGQSLFNATKLKLRSFRTFEEMLNYCYIPFETVSEHPFLNRIEHYSRKLLLLFLHKVENFRVFRFEHYTC